MIGSQINQYKILEKIGSGGQGTVYKALDTKLNRTAVIKVLPPELTQKTANFKCLKTAKHSFAHSSTTQTAQFTIFTAMMASFTSRCSISKGKNVRQLVAGWPLDLKSA